MDSLKEGDRQFLNSLHTDLSSSESFDRVQVELGRSETSWAGRSLPWIFQNVKLFAPVVTGSVSSWVNTLTLTPGWLCFIFISFIYKVTSCFSEAQYIANFGCNYYRLSGIYHSLAWQSTLYVLWNINRIEIHDLSTVMLTTMSVLS